MELESAIEYYLQEAVVMKLVVTRIYVMDTYKKQLL